MICGRLKRKKMDWMKRKKNRTSQRKRKYKPSKTRALTKTQNGNWLSTILCREEWLRNFFVILAVSAAAVSQVSALDNVGSFTTSCHSSGGYAIRWCNKIMEVLCVICARVRFGSMVITVGCREMFESFHFWGSSIFQLSPVRECKLEFIIVLRYTRKSLWNIRD